MKAPDDSVSDNDPTRMRMRAFSADSTLAAIEVDDDRGGLYLRIVTLKDGSAVKTYRFDEASARSVWKKARRKHGLLERGPQTAAHPKLEALTLMGSDTADAVLVNVAKGERVVPYLRIRRLPEAAVAFKTLAFSPDGKRLVAIHTQTRVVGGRQISHDFFHAVPFKQYRLPF